MNADADHGKPSRDLSTWTIERLRTFVSEAQGQELEAVRLVAQDDVYRADEPREARQQWAKLSLRANQRLPGDGLWERTRAAQQNFMLRMWVIDQLGPDDEDHDWSPETLADDTVKALALTPAEARALADHWRDLAVEQIGELRRHKNLTAHDDSARRPKRRTSMAWWPAGTSSRTSSGTLLMATPPWVWQTLPGELSLFSRSERAREARDEPSCSRLHLNCHAVMGCGQEARPCCAAFPSSIPRRWGPDWDAWVANRTRSRCGTPLLHFLYLSKGVHGRTARRLHHLGKLWSRGRGYVSCVALLAGTSSMPVSADTVESTLLRPHSQA